MRDTRDTEKDFLESIIKQDAERKRTDAAEKKVITFREYIELLREDPYIAQNSPARLLELLLDRGIEEIPEHERWLGVSKRYKVFSGVLFGVDKPMHEFMEYLGTGAVRLSTGKQPVVFVGPPASGKSTAVSIIKRELEAYRRRPVFFIKGCPKHEEPLHLLPRHLRAEFEKKFGVKIEGDLCPWCRYHLMDAGLKGEDGSTIKYKEADGVIRWWDFPVEKMTFSRQGARGIGSFEPSDEKSQDVSELVGREVVGISQNPRFGPTHPHAWDLNGEIEHGERGIVEAREIFKKGIDERILWVFINVAEEKELKVQGSSFPHISVDTVTIGHCNLEGFKDFSADSGQEGLHNRFYVIQFPYPLRVRDEVSIYRKLIESESDYRELGNCHIAPGTFELTAIFTILTRLKPSNMGISSLDKMRVYNGEKVLVELKDKDQNPVDLRALIEEGQADDDIAKREGMFGVSSRDVLAALNTAIVREAHNGCLTPLRAIRALRDVFDHRMGYSPEEVAKFRELLSSGEGGSVMEEYRDYVLKAVSRAFLKAYDDLSRDLFRQYIDGAEFVRNQTRRFVRGEMKDIERDDLTGRPKDVDTVRRFLRSIEQHIDGVDESGATIFRGEILEIKGSPGFGYDTYPPLRQAVEEKLLSDAKETLKLVLDPTRPKDEEAKKRTGDLFEELEKTGHCKICAAENVKNAAEFLSE
ncbi:MAG: hypothetical protein WAP23_03300 [Candidatus Spechtbacterales bacterium]